VAEVAACVGETVSLACYTTERMGVDWRYRLSAANSHGSYVVASGYIQWNYRHVAVSICTATVAIC